MTETLSILYAFSKILVGFVVIIIYLKLSNKSQVSELTPIDFIGNFIIGGIVGGMIYNPDISFFRYFIMLVSAILLISCLNYISSKFMFARRAIMSVPIPVIVEGKMQLDWVTDKKLKVDLIQFMSMLRAKNIFSLEEVESAQIEANGELTVIKKGEGAFNYLLVQNGVVLSEELTQLGKEEDWLLQHMRALNIDLEEVFLVEFSNKSHFYIVKNNGTVVSKDIKPISLLS